MTDLPTINPDVLDDMLKEILLPNFLQIILPTVVLILIFGIVRIVFRCLLRDSRRLAILVDGLCWGTSHHVHDAAHICSGQGI